MGERTLTISRSKKIWGFAAEWYVYIDNQRCAALENGKSVSVKLSCNEHYVLVAAQDVKSKPFRIPANICDYHLVAEQKMGWSVGNILLEEDYYQAEKNKKILEQQQRDNEMKARIKRVIDPLMEKVEVERDFSVINRLDQETRNSQFMKNFIINIKEAYYKNSAKGLYEEKSDLCVVLQVLKSLEVFPEIQYEIQRITRHYDYIVTRKNDINSVLSLNVEEDLLKIEKNRESFADDFLDTWKIARKEYEAGNMYKVLEKLLLADYPETELDKLKRCLLNGAMMEGKEEGGTEYYEAILGINKWVFQLRFVDENAKTITVKNVDMIIAEAIRYNNVNAIDSINGDLRQFLDKTTHIYKVGAAQYTILQKVFAYLKAYNQEKMVLEAMMKNMIERTPEQEERLRYLQAGRGAVVKGLHSNIMTATENESMVGEEGMIYEYRCMTWKNDERKIFFDTMSMENKTIHIPIVISEWTKNIEVKGIEWDPAEVSERVFNVLSKCFEKRFQVNVLPTSISSVRLDFSMSVFCMEQPGNPYPWLAFNICGEQTMLNRLTLAIYGMYMPDFDLAIDMSVFERNNKIADMVEMLKEKHNPKINNFIQSITDLLVEELEHWVNDMKISNIYT